MKIGIYVWDDVVKGKRVLKNEVYDSKQNAGMAVVRDIVARLGFDPVYVGIAEAHTCDYVLVSMGSDDDWWRFLQEKRRWSKGKQKVVVGGPAVLNVLPFLDDVDFFVLGRAEGVLEKFLLNGDTGNSIIDSKAFKINNRYTINQVENPYDHEILLGDGSKYKEGNIGCPYKCFFCGYSWHRKFTYKHEKRYNPYDEYCSKQNQESAILDFIKDPNPDYKHIRTTALDGLSERIRFKANKKISNDAFLSFVEKFYYNASHRQLKVFNIVGYPEETEEDWFDFLRVMEEADRKIGGHEKAVGLVLNTTPFRAFPATPFACSKMSYKEYRGEIARILGKEYREKTGNHKRINTIYSGENIYANENGFTQGLASSALAAIVWRGEESDSENVRKIAFSKKFWNASVPQKCATLEKYFDINKLFGEYTPQNLPTRYLQTYANIEKMWKK